MGIDEFAGDESIGTFENWSDGVLVADLVKLLRELLLDLCILHETMLFLWIVLLELFYLFDPFVSQKDVLVIKLSVFEVTRKDVFSEDPIVLR